MSVQAPPAKKAKAGKGLVHVAILLSSQEEDTKVDRIVSLPRDLYEKLVAETEADEGAPMRLAIAPSGDKLPIYSTSTEDAEPTGVDWLTSDPNDDGLGLVFRTYAGKVMTFEESKKVRCAEVKQGSPEQPIDAMISLTLVL